MLKGGGGPSLSGWGGAACMCQSFLHANVGVDEAPPPKRIFILTRFSHVTIFLRV